MTQKKGINRRAKKSPPRTYRQPHTAAELGIVCAECGQPAEWFDHERGKRDHLKGFICSKESRSAGSDKLLVNEQGSAPGA